MRTTRADPVRTGALMLCLAMVAPAFAQEMTGRVVGVHDGDTLTVLTADKRQARIRLADIDAPELGQPFGQAAKRALSDLCFNRPAHVQTRTVDQYGRTVGVVTCAGHDASREMVQRGMAWAYRAYLKRPELVLLEEAAKGTHTGLWSQPAAAPWEYRKLVKEAATVSASAPSPARSPQVVHTGPRGGKYVINAAGHKEYLAGH